MVYLQSAIGLGVSAEGANVAVVTEDVPLVSGEVAREYVVYVVGEFATVFVCPPGLFSFEELAASAGAEVFYFLWEYCVDGEFVVTFKWVTHLCGI